MALTPTRTYIVKRGFQDDIKELKSFNSYEEASAYRDLVQASLGESGPHTESVWIETSWISEPEARCSTQATGTSTSTDLLAPIIAKIDLIAAEMKSIDKTISDIFESVNEINEHLSEIEDRGGRF